MYALFCIIYIVKKRKIKIRALFIVFFIVAILVRNYFCACNIILAKAKAQFEADSVSAFYSAVNSCLVEGSDFADLIRVEKNSDGNITFVSTNALKLNSIARRTAVNSLEKLNKKSGGKVKIPLGAYFGLNLFSGYGVETAIKLINVSSVKCDFTNEFYSCGINMVTQKCFISVEFDARIVLPTKTEKVRTKVKMPVYDNFISGNVPDAFLSGVVAGYTLTNSQ